MHLVDVEHGFMGATGVVGGNIPIALGSALAARLRGDDAVAVVFFGDGAVQAGHFNETVNLATLWKLPLILVCENNGFAEFTPRSAHTTIERVSDVVAPYDVERATVDGNDVLAVWDAFAGYLASARDGGGPFLLECLTVPPRRALRGRCGQVSRGHGGCRMAGPGSDPPAAAPRVEEGGSPRMSSRRSKRRLSRRSTGPSSSGARARSHPSALIDEMVYARG